LFEREVESRRNANVEDEKKKKRERDLEKGNNTDIAELRLR
jgi:hypothetical protein